MITSIVCGQRWGEALPAGLLLERVVLLIGGDVRVLTEAFTVCEFL